MTDTAFFQLRERLARGDFLLSAWSSLTDPAIVEILARAPFDALLFDMQHGQHDFSSVQAGVTRAALLGKPTLVRVPIGDLANVSRALDLGAGAVIMPMIETAADAKAFVDAVKYPPLGKRSFGPARAVQLHGFAGGQDYFAAANAQSLAIAMIETPEAYRDLDEILAVDGLDGVFVGPSDLSISLSGGTLAHDGPQADAAIRAIAQKTKAAGRFSAIYTFNAAEAERCRGYGYDIACISSDAQMIAEAAAALAGSVSRR